MSLKGKYFISGVALSVPLLMIVGRVLLAGDARLLEPTTVMLNWLYFAAPQLFALVVALLHRPSRRFFLFPAITSSGVVLAAFQAWIWYFVPPRESGIAWLLYLPLWAVVLMAIAIATAWRYRTKTDL